MNRNEDFIFDDVENTQKKNWKSIWQWHHTYKQETQFWYTSPLISDKLGLPFDSYDSLLVSITLNISCLYCAKRYFVVVAPKKPFGWLLY